jgi:peroxiredoxin
MGNKNSPWNFSRNIQFARMNEGPFTQLPANLPVPADDGACAHLFGRRPPDVSLLSTSGRHINLRQRRGLIVLYAYPLTGRPGVALPAGWDEIPGARGCTPESCSFRDHHAEIGQLGAEVFGLSTQSTDYQREVRARLHLSFDLLSDEAFAFTDALCLPTFSVASLRLLRRVTLICLSGVIEHVFYPIFPPDRHPADVVSYLKGRKA